MHSSILPIITMTDLQRHPREALDTVIDYAVIQSHGNDKAFVLSPTLGRVLMESGMLDLLREKVKERGTMPTELEKTLTGLVGNVLRELSKK